MKRPCPPKRIRSGFTLIELLVVIAIMAVLSALTIPVFTSLKRANDLDTATSTIAALLEQARSYAMANNTYVFVCFEETNEATPSNQMQTPGTGRVTVQLFSSLDATLDLTSANLAAITRRQIIDNMDLPQSLTATSGTLSQRPTATYIIGSADFPAASGTVVSGNFTFSKIMAFDPQGIVHLPSSPPQAALQYLEIDVQQSNGSAVPAVSNNVRAIQVDGLTGTVTIYRS